MADQKILNIDNSGEVPFIYTEEAGVPSWAALMPDSWINKIAGQLYDFAKKNFLVVVDSDLSNRNDFVFGISRSIFANWKFDLEIGIIQKYLLALHETTANSTGNIGVLIYVSFFSDSNDNFIHAIIDGNNIIIGAKLDNVVGSNNRIIV